MPIPSPEDQLKLLKAYDLNPLVQLELQHSYELCTTNSFVSSRKNKQQRSKNQPAVYESSFLNIALRDMGKLEKLRVIKVVHALIHRKMFIFYQKQQMLIDISDMLINVFGFQPNDKKDTVIRISEQPAKVPNDSRQSRVSTVYEELYKQNIGQQLRDQQIQARQKMSEINASRSMTMQKTTMIGLSDSEEPLLCTDIIFALLNDAFNRTEPIVQGFTGESKALNSDVARRKASERIEVIGRAYIAREMCIELQKEISNKLDFLHNVEHLGIKSGVNFYETAIKIRFLQGRL